MTKLQAMVLTRNMRDAFKSNELAHFEDNLSKLELELDVLHSKIGRQSDKIQELSKAQWQDPSETCATYNIQKCSFCDRLDCKDNMALLAISESDKNRITVLTTERDRFKALAEERNKLFFEKLEVIDRLTKENEELRNPMQVVHPANIGDTPKDTIAGEVAKDEKALKN